MTRWPTTEESLETGLVVFAGVLVGSLALYAMSHLVGEAQRWVRHAAGPPLVGTIPIHRHQNIAADNVS
jgi:hypothetical protein